MSKVIWIEECPRWHWIALAALGDQQPGALWAAVAKDRTGPLGHLWTEWEEWLFGHA